MPEQPLVTVLTPVYNGEAFICECIESVLNQSYQNYEYIILNNCSKDRTLELASNYAKKDRRIRVHNSPKFVGVIENHNNAFQLMSRESKYCKVVSGDDWLFPHCITTMVDAAEANPSVGIFGSYQLSGCGSNGRQWDIKWTHLPYPGTVIDGREISRSHLLGGPYVFGTPTSILYRSDIVREHAAFYPNPSAHADLSACYRALQKCNFGFIHQVLSYERVHDDRQTAKSDMLNRYLSHNIGDLLAYGPIYLTKEEVERRLKELLDDYYESLAIGAVNFRPKEYWTYHRDSLRQVGYPLSNLRLGQAISLKVLDLLLNPKRTCEILYRRATHAG